MHLRQLKHSATDYLSREEHCSAAVNIVGLAEGGLLDAMRGGREAPLAAKRSSDPPVMKPPWSAGGDDQAGLVKLAQSLTQIKINRLGLNI